MFLYYKYLSLIKLSIFVIYYQLFYLKLIRKSNGLSINENRTNKNKAERFILQRIYQSKEFEKTHLTRVGLQQNIIHCKTMHNHNIFTSLCLERKMANGYCRTATVLRRGASCSSYFPTRIENSPLFLI